MQQGAAVCLAMRILSWRVLLARIVRSLGGATAETQELGKCAATWHFVMAGKCFKWAV